MALNRLACSEPNDTHRTLAMIVTLHLIETRRSDGLLQSSVYMPSERPSAGYAHQTWSVFVIF